MTSRCETIYNLVPHVHKPAVKPKMYRSKFDPKSLPTGSSIGCFGTTRLIGAGQSVKNEKGTFGKLPKDEKPDPKKFLKIEEKMKRVPFRAEDIKKFNYQGERRVSVPRRDERPVMGLKTSKNFITANAVETILQVPRVPETNEPDYLKKADYGKVPSYLAQVNKEISRENALIDAYVREQMDGCEPNEGTLDELGELEKLELLHALKEKWGAVNTKYQKITHIVNMDTMGKVKRKEQMEKELERIETDIGKLERPGPVLIRSA